MEINAAFILLVLGAGTVAFVWGGVWLLVLPFKESVRWGMACILPPVQWYYAITRFNRCKLPLQLYVGGFTALIAGYALTTHFVLTPDMNQVATSSPTQIVEHPVPMNKSFRLRGTVQIGSVKKLPGGRGVQFAIHDEKHSVPVEYLGILPDLFREGNDAVVQGSMDQNRFIARFVMTKLDG